VITSTKNSKVQALRSLRQRRDRLTRGWYLAEGVRLVEEAMKAGVIPALMLFSPAALTRTSRGAALLRDLTALETRAWPATDAAIAAASDTQTPQGVVAALPLPSTDDAPLQGSLALVLDGVQDPGNLGTILRAAWATGVTEILTTLGTADPFGPKAVRAGMGAHFHLRLRPDQSWGQIAALATDRTVLLATAHGDIRYDAVDWHRPGLLILGSEAHGPTPAALQLATTRVYIPMAKGVESLNVAVAAAVLLFEFQRQNRSVEASPDAEGTGGGRTYERRGNSL
jgi:TrmH family RNA methyltransferase